MAEITLLERLRDMVEKRSLFPAKEGEEFTLSSGSKSPWYLELKRVLLLPEGASLCRLLAVEGRKKED